MSRYLVFLLLLSVISIWLQDSFVFSLIYILLGLYILDNWLSGKGIKSVLYKRLHVSHAFIGEKIPIQLEVINRGWLPIVWLRLQDSLPLELAAPGSFKRVISLGMHSQVNFNYDLLARKRGVYQLGPITVNSGDIFGFGGAAHQSGLVTKLLIYPSIRSMQKFSLPSHSPLGNLTSPQIILYDPNRIRGKRDYISGDSFRQIDWKTTASKGKIQVKQFEPTINIASILALNLNLMDYDFRRRIEASELAIVTAASIANWIVQQRQSIGLVTNGLISADGGIPVSIYARKGRAHLMRVLEILAQLKALETTALENLVSDYRGKFSWGTTMVLITGDASDPLFHEIYTAQRAGIKPVLVMVGNVQNLAEIRHKASIFKTPFKHIRNELDLESWEGWQ